MKPLILQKGELMRLFDGRGERILTLQEARRRTRV